MNELSTEQPPTVVQAISAVMGDVQAVGKNGTNTQQNYSFRGVDDVVNAVGPALRKHGVVVLPDVLEATYSTVEVGRNRTQMRECTLRIRYTFVGPAGDTLEATVYGESMDSGDKATAKAHSVAFRTALLQALCIPTDEPEPDASSYERAEAVVWATPEQLGEVKALSAGLDDTGKAAMRTFVEGHGIDLKRMTTEQASQVLAELERVSATRPGVVPPRSPEGTAVGEEEGADEPESLTASVDEGTPNPSEGSGTPSKAARDALARTAKR